MAEADIRPTPSRVPGTSIKVPKSIRDSTNEILGELDPSIPICVVAQVLKDGDETVVRGAVYARLRKGLSFMTYVSTNLEPKGLKLGAELRWTP